MTLNDAIAFRVLNPVCDYCYTPGHHVQCPWYS